MLGEKVRRLFRFAHDDTGSVKTRVVRSGIWVSLSGAIGGILGILRSIVLARLLTPEMFGLMGLASIAIRTIDTFTRPGVSQALIARQKAFDEASATAFALLIGRGVLLAILMLASAAAIASFYGAAELESILAVLSLTFIIGSFANINTIARQRELEFRSLTYLGLVVSLLTTVVTIAAAFWLRNVWALVIGQLVSASLTTLLSYHFVAGKVRIAFDWTIAKELMTYGKFITGSSIMMFIAAELDSLVLGKLVSLEALGLYTLAYTIANLVTANISKIVSSIMMPAYSKLQVDVAAVRGAYLRSLNFVMFGVLPVTTGLILIAEPLILNIYGPKWVPAARGLQILAVFGLLRALASFTGYLFEGIGMPRIAFQIGTLRLLSVAPLIVPMVFWLGLEGAAITATIGVTVQWLVGVSFLSRKLTLSLSELMKTLWRPLWTSLVMGACVVTMELLVQPVSMLGLVALVTTGATVYVALNVRTLRALRHERFG